MIVWALSQAWPWVRSPHYINLNKIVEKRLHFLINKHLPFDPFSNLSFVLLQEPISVVFSPQGSPNMERLADVSKLLATHITRGASSRSS